MDKKTPIQRSKTLTSNFKKTNKSPNLHKRVGIVEPPSPINNNFHFQNLRNSMKPNKNDLSMKQVNFEDLVNLKKNMSTPEKKFLSKEIHYQVDSEYNRISSANLTDNSNKPFETISTLVNKNILSKIGKNSNNVINKLKIKSFTSTLYKTGKNFFRPSLTSINSKTNNTYQSNKYVPQTPMTRNKLPFSIENSENLKRNTGKNILPAFSLNNTKLSKNGSLRKSIAGDYRKFSIYYNGTSRTSFISIATSEENITFNNINNMKTAVFGNHENPKSLSGKFINAGKVSIDYKEFENLEKINKRVIKIYFICGIFCILSLVCSCIDIEEYIENSNKYLNEKYIQYSKNEIKASSIFEEMKYRELSLIENLSRILNGIFSLLSTGTIIYRYIITNQIIEKNKSMKNKKSKEIKMTLFDNVFKRDNKIILVIEGIICIIFYPPFINKTFHGKFCDIDFVVPLNTIFYFLNSLKIIPIYSFYKSYSQYNSLYSKKILYDKGIKINNNFIFKATYSKYPLISSIFCTVYFIFFYSFFLQSVEAFAYNVKKAEFNYINENGLTYSLVKIIWLTLKRFPGQLTPMTPLGKIVLYIIGLFGLIFICFFVKYIIGLMDFKPQEQKAYSKLQKLFNPENKIHKAANLIKLTIIKKKLLVDFEKKKLNDADLLNEKKYNNFLQEKNKFYLNKFVLTIKTSIYSKNFTDDFKIASNYSLPIDDILITFQNRMLENEANASNRIDFYLDMHAVLQNMVKINEKSIESVINSNRIQNEIIKFLLNFYSELISKKDKKLKINVVDKNLNQTFDKSSDKNSQKPEKSRFLDLEYMEDEDQQKNYSLQKLPSVKKMIQI